MDPFNKLNLDSDTSISLIKEAKSQGIDVWISYPSELSYEMNKAFTIAYRVSREGLRVCSPQRKDLDKFDFFFIRQDPPFLGILFITPSGLPSIKITLLSP